MDTPSPFTRFKAVLFTLFFFVAFALVSLFMRWANKPRKPIDDAASSQRLSIKAEIENAAAESIEKLGLEFRSAQGGHLPTIVVPDAVIEKSLVKLQAKQGHKTDKVIPGTETYMKQQEKPQ